MERKQNPRSNVVAKNDQGEEGIRMTARHLQEASRIFRRLPKEQAFYFFTSVGNYTGESAASLEEFIEKIKEVNAKSLEFHLSRGDFEKWTADVLQDTELAGDIKRLQKLNLTGNSLRDQLNFTISRRFKHLTDHSSTSRL